MALSKPLEDLLLQITDDGDRTLMRERFEKYDFLQNRFNGNLRQEDYDRNMNKLKTERESEQKLVEQYKTQSEKWDQWAVDNVPKHDRLLKEFSDLENKYKSLEDEKTALVLAKAAAGEGGTPVDEKALMAQVNETIAKHGYVPKAELPALVTAEAKKLVDAERETFFKTTVPAMFHEMNSMNSLLYKHDKEFNEILDQEKFATFRAEKKIQDINDAYSQFTSDKRKEREIATIRKEEREKAEKEFASKFNLPGSGAPPSTEGFGPVQERAMGKAATFNPDKPSWVEAADALRSEGKF